MQTNQSLLFWTVHQIRSPDPVILETDFENPAGCFIMLKKLISWPFDSGHDQAYKQFFFPLIVYDRSRRYIEKLSGFSLMHLIEVCVK